MKMKIKFGDTKLKISYKDLMRQLNGNKNPFEIFSRFNLELTKFYVNIPQAMLDYYNELSRIFTKYLDTAKPVTGKIPDSPDILPANGHDIYNYVARYRMGNYHSQAVMMLDGRLDYDKLSKAVRLSVDAEPVLGCRFIEEDPPYWKRLENIDNVRFCSLAEVSDADAAIQRFLERPLDMDHDPNIKVKLIRTESQDTLVIKANHACCDGTGIKEYAHLLANIYCNIEQPDGTFISTSSKRGRNDQDRLFKSLGITHPDALWIPGSDIYIPTWSFPWKQDVSSNIRIVIIRLTQDQLGEISTYAKSREATINDLILTAYYRAMLKMGLPVYGVPMEINVTIDLRRYLPDYKTEAIRNFSGSANTWISMIENEAFSDTLSRVVYMMNEVKKGYPGLQSAIGLERLEKISFKDTLSYYQATPKIGKNKSQCSVFYGNRCIPALSNLGILSKQLIKFGDANVTDYFIIPPVVSAPGILLVANTYNSIMSFAVGFFENTVLHEDMERFLNNIRDELLEGCKM
jgi:Uncharacterized protein containing a NRPS condensation (elongation) domain